MASSDFDPIQFKPLGPCGAWHRKFVKNWPFQWIHTIIQDNMDTAIALGTVVDQEGWKWAGNSHFFGWIQATMVEIPQATWRGRIKEKLHGRL